MEFSPTAAVLSQLLHHPQTSETSDPAGLTWTMETENRMKRYMPVNRIFRHVNTHTAVKETFLGIHKTTPTSDCGVNAHEQRKGKESFGHNLCQSAFVG